MSEFITREEFDEYKKSAETPRDRVESAVDGALGEHVASGNQLVYANTQFFKFDPAWFTVNERGLSIAGVEVFRFPGLHALENSLFSSEERRRRRADREEAESQRIQEGLDRLRAVTREDENGVRSAASATDVQRAQQTANGAQRYALELGGQVARTKQAVGSQIARMRTDVGTADRLAKSAHTRIDGINRQQTQQSRRLSGVAAQPSVAAQNPQRLKDAAEQVRALESRVNSLIRALA
ncbi:hypothetical protein [Streptomyces sp. CFMR 7]|uniref:hypothetical protein n=1 Tax=Streptomyces sp. CFMR 7 TaxID=1649184 RepID=UPI0011A1E823|nr:hypothetical protein [Streptomyces sp. CFMR 7]